MNYKKIYNKLIDIAKNRYLNCYYEKHHIIPKCMGGSDEDGNIVKLTPEEHYIAHQLLIRIFPEEEKLIYAAIAMRPARPNNKLYGWIRRRYSKIVSKRQSGENNNQFGTIWVSNILTRQTTRIKKDQQIPDGWVRGRNAWNKQFSRCKTCNKEFSKISTKVNFCSDECKSIKQTKTRKYQNGYVVQVDDIIYQSISEAADSFSMNHETARMRFKSNSFPNWKIINSE